MPARALALLVLAATALVAACGGGRDGGMSRGDAAFAERVRSEIGQTNRLLAPVLDCAGDVACLRSTGGPLGQRAYYAATNLADDTEALDDPCLRDIGRTIVGYFEAVGDVGRAAEAGDLDSVGIRSERVDREGRSIQDQIVACVEGAEDHPGLAAAREITAVFATLDAPFDRIEACDDVPCLVEGGAAVRATAEAGVARLSAIDAGALPPCNREALAAARRAFGSYVQGGAAFAAAAPERALVHFERAAKAEADMARAAASCTR